MFIFITMNNPGPYVAAGKALPEQELHAWEKVSMQRLRIGTDTTTPVVEAASDVDSGTRNGCNRIWKHIEGYLEREFVTPYL